VLAVGTGVGVAEGSGVLPGVDGDGVGVGAGLDRRGLGKDGVALGDGEVLLGDGVGEWLGESGGGFVGCCPVCGLSWPGLLVVVVLSGRIQK
jgi:hypothetical protein